MAVLHRFYCTIYWGYSYPVIPRFIQWAILSLLYVAVWKTTLDWKPSSVSKAEWQWTGLGGVYGLFCVHSKLSIFFRHNLIMGDCIYQTSAGQWVLRGGARYPYTCMSSNLWNGQLRITYIPFILLKALLFSQHKWHFWKCGLEPPGRYSNFFIFIRRLGPSIYRSPPKISEISSTPKIFEILATPKKYSPFCTLTLRIDHKMHRNDP